jgi:hypothetical protein
MIHALHNFPARAPLRASELAAARCATAGDTTAPNPPSEPPAPPPAAPPVPGGVYSQDILRRLRNEQARLSRATDNERITAEQTDQLTQQHQAVQQKLDEFTADGVLTHDERRELNHDLSALHRELQRARHPAPSAPATEATPTEEIPTHD